VHERYRQTTDGRTMTYSERELEFTFAKNELKVLRLTLTKTLKAVCLYGYSLFTQPSLISFSGSAAI